MLRDYEGLGGIPTLVHVPSHSGNTAMIADDYRRGRAWSRLCWPMALAMLH